MSASATKSNLDSEWYGANKKRYSASDTIVWATKTLSVAENDFAELATAVGNKKKPIPAKFFKVFALSDQKCLSIFKLLRPRRFASLVEAAFEQNDKERAKLWSDIFKPHLSGWEQTLSFIENRFPGQAKIIELRQVFGTISSLQHKLICNPTAATKDAIKDYMNAFDKLWPLWEMLATLLPVGRTPLVPSGSSRRHYDKYCLKEAALAALFDVDIKTISRWKSADTLHGQEFRSCKDSRAKMEHLARVYKAQKEYGRDCRAKGIKATKRVSYSESIGADGEDD